MGRPNLGIMEARKQKVLDAIKIEEMKQDLIRFIENTKILPSDLVSRYNDFLLERRKK
jgi:hypothetical protein